MKRWMAFALGAFLALPTLGRAQYPAVGSPAPGFTLKDAHGREVSLAAFRGKLVVLEWVNPDCPFVHKHYDSGNMQRLQSRYTRRGGVWLSIDSSGPGSEGCLKDPQAARAFIRERRAHMTDLLLDPRGLAGRAYGAKNTPTMFVIDRAGRIAYEGAIDDKPGTDPAEIPGARNYVSEALDELLAGRPVKVPATRAYGCHIPYAD